MPHLILGFTAEREMEIDLDFGKSKPTGNEHFSIKMIDTDKGEVVEITADARDVKQKVRQPNHAELLTASKALGKEPGDGIAAKQFQELQDERDSYRQKHTSAQSTITAHEARINKLRSDNERLKKEVTSEDEKKIMADALDEKIMGYAALQDWENYGKAKKMYRKLTGQGWADDDEEVD